MAEKDDETTPNAPDDSLGEILDGAKPDDEAAEPDGAAAPADDAKPADEAGATTGATADAGGDKPGTPAVQPEVDRTVRQPVTVAADAQDAKIDAAIKAIEADEMLTPGQKAAELVRLEDLKESRAIRRQSQADDAEERTRNQAAADFGVTRKVLDQSWEDSVVECQKKFGKFSYEAAMLILESKLAGKKTPAPIVKEEKTYPNRVPITKPGGSVSPAATTNRPPLPKKDPAEAFAASVTKDDLNDLV